MTLRVFIQKNRPAIDEVIQRRCPNAPKRNDEERRQWVLNDENLYLWAKSEGVKI